MKDIELRLISELIKNSRMSDREMAKRLHISQPTVSRIRSRLEKEKRIREYTMIPDFMSLGFQVGSVTLARLDEPMSQKVEDDIMESAQEIEKASPSPVIIAMNGIGLNADYVIVALHKDYSEYVTFMEYMKHFPHVKVDEIKSFMISLDNRNHFRYLTLTGVANQILRTKEVRQ